MYGFEVAFSWALDARPGPLELVEIDERLRRRPWDEVPIEGLVISGGCCLMSVFSDPLLLAPEESLQPGSRLRAPNAVLSPISAGASPKQRGHRPVR